jgi:hypothetical protein
MRGYALFLAESVSTALRCGIFRSIEGLPIVFGLGVETKKNMCGKFRDEGLIRHTF